MVIGYFCCAEAVVSTSPNAMIPATRLVQVFLLIDAFIMSSELLPVQGALTLPQGKNRWLGLLLEPVLPFVAALAVTVLGVGVEFDGIRHHPADLREGAGSSRDFRRAVEGAAFGPACREHRIRRAVPLEKYLVSILQHPDPISPGRANAIGVIGKASIPFLDDLHAVEHDLAARMDSMDFQDANLMSRNIADIDHMLLDVAALDPVSGRIDRVSLLGPG